MSRIEEILNRLRDIPDMVLDVDRCGHGNSVYGLYHEGDYIGEASMEGDAQIWAHSYSDLRYLLAEVERLQTENTWLKSKLPF
jgi:hypothetical protein